MITHLQFIVLRDGARNQAGGMLIVPNSGLMPLRPRLPIWRMRPYLGTALDAHHVRVVNVRGGKNT